MIYLLSVMDNKKGIQKFQKKKIPFYFFKKSFFDGISHLSFICDIINCFLWKCSVINSDK
jgi:hypothetical protein